MNKMTESELSGLKSRFEREEQAMADINKYNSLAQIAPGTTKLGPVHRNAFSISTFDSPAAHFNSYHNVRSSKPGRYGNN